MWTIVICSFGLQSFLSITWLFKLYLFFSVSPYKVKVLPTHDASKVRASGPGLNTTGVPASLPVEFTIDAKDAGEGLLAVQITVSAYIIQINMRINKSFL